MKGQKNAVICGKLFSDKSQSNNYNILFAIITWIGCSSVTQISNKKVLSGGTSPLTLFSFQMLFGTVTYFLLLSVSKHRHNNVWWRKSPNPSTEVKYLPFVIGFYNAMSHLLTLCAMQSITPALTHITRGTEPTLCAGKL